MYVRLLTQEDFKNLDAYLEPHTGFTFFIRSNAHKGGLDYRGQPYQSEVFGAFKDGDLVGVLSHAWLGHMQVFMTDKSAAVALASTWREHHDGKPRKLSEILGPMDDVLAIRQALGIDEHDLRAGGRDEYLFTLDISTMNVPPQLHEPEYIVRRATIEDGATLIPWRYEFYMEALGDPGGEDARRRAEANINGMIHEKNVYVLEYRGQIVSFCGCGGYLPDWRGIGPVWTPVSFRGKGYARIVTAGALNIVRAGGVRHAVLFSENPQAIRLYEALGFQKIGRWKLDFLINPERSFS
ncbi:MAG: GNAT family N-acetyltransferase [Alphaproteobacteria bacterium]|nr:GNAT family N-acetyltransferase [Alphaproteobacteria bacterium]MBV8549088.1 GNAT family N-acetyltransferase [Alphaproteobacteria bacterium]